MVNPTERQWTAGAVGVAEIELALARDLPELFHVLTCQMAKSLAQAVTDAPRVATPGCALVTPTRDVRSCGRDNLVADQRVEEMNRPPKRLRSVDGERGTTST